MTFALDLDLRQIGQGIYNYVQAGLNDAIPRWADMAGDMVLDNWRLAATGRMYPGMTRTLHSDAYRMALERSTLRMERDAVTVVVSAPAEVQLQHGRAFDLHRRIEFGAPPYSIRAGWLRHGGSPKTRYGKNGAYVIIPFRHGSGESVHFRSNLSPTVRAMARGAAVTERRYSGIGNPWSSAATKFTPQQGSAVHLGLGPRFRKTVNTNSGRYQYTWQRAILAGVKRYGRAGHSQYLTFRTMSESGSPNAWIVPALPANPVAQSVVAYARDRISERIRADMQQMAPGGARP